jgi:hypothetical protein
MMVYQKAASSAITLVKPAPMPLLVHRVMTLILLEDSVPHRLIAFVWTGILSPRPALRFVSLAIRLVLRVLGAA